MERKYKKIFNASIICIGALICTTPNSIFKDKFNVNKIEISENDMIQRYLEKNESFEGIVIIKNNIDDNKLSKYEEAYVILKNEKDKYYNNVNLKEEKDAIIISYDEEDINDEYKNDLYNTRVDKVMILRIKANDNINNIEIVKN